MRRVLAVMPFVSCSGVVRAQSTNAFLSGRVIDPARGVIVGAQVAAINTGSNFRSEAATNGAGQYYLTNLPPGSYQVEIAKSGFKKLVKPDVVLHVQDVLAIDFEMALGSASESVTVEGGAPVVNTESAAASTVVDHAFVDNLPLNDRSFQTLIMLTPSVAVTATAFDDQGHFSVNGQRGDADFLTIDGVSANFGVNGYGPLVQTAGGAERGHFNIDSTSSHYWRIPPSVLGPCFSLVMHPSEIRQYGTCNSWWGNEPVRNQSE